MLVITRRKGERIVIGEDIEVVVTELSRSTVKLAIRAPSHTQIVRGEVFDAVAEENRVAAENALAGALPTPEPAR